MLCLRGQVAISTLNIISAKPMPWTAVKASRRITTATRVGTIAAHPAADGHVIGYGNAGTPSTTRFYGIDAREGTAREVVPDGWLSGTVVRGQAFERRGQRWFVIDSLGNLTVLARGASGWSTVHRAASLLPAMPLITA